MICKDEIVLHGDTKWLEDLEETHLTSLKRSEVKALDHCLSQLLETVATV